MKSREFVKPFRIADGSNFRLKDYDPAETVGLKSKEHAKEILERGIMRLTHLQEKLYAQDRWAILLNLQAMDAAGKDSTIKHVMSGVNPQGCQVHFVQGAFARGTGTRFLVANFVLASRARSDRHFQSLLL